MSTASIVLLVLGVVFFGASFFLPDFGKKEENKSQEIDDKLIKQMVEREVIAAKEKIEDIVDETVNYSVEKTERQLEKLSNEKIMAVDEYSETVLKRINENHKEAVFLYDMLNDKGEQLKNSNEVLKVKDEELKEKDRQLEVKEEVLKVKDEVLKQKDEEIKERTEEVKQAVKEAVMESDDFVPLNAPKVKRPVRKPNTGKAVKPVTNSEKAVPEAMPGQTVETENPQEKLSASHRVSSPEEVEIHFDRDNESRKNKNEQIRKMHNEGKSNMAIAKELGLGVGEVKLVIDLFANKK